MVANGGRLGGRMIGYRRETRRERTGAGRASHASRSGATRLIPLVPGGTVGSFGLSRLRHRPNRLKPGLQTRDAGVSREIDGVSRWGQSSHGNIFAC